MLVAGLAAIPAAGQNLNLRDLEFTGITPCRLIDTRNGGGASSSDDGPVGARSSPGPYDIAVRTFCGVPAIAQAVVLNLTVVAPTQAGDLRIGPTDAEPFPVVSTVNYAAGVGALANGAIVPLSKAPGNEVRMVFAMVGVGSLHILVDVAGYFGPPGSGPLWGRGRPGTGRWGMSGLNSGLCSNGVYNFGLSTTAVEWSGAADACPQGTWVCTETQRGTGTCFTVRTDGLCDARHCDESCIDWSTNSHFGWLADTTVPTEGRFIGEGGVTVSSERLCMNLPVWCCALN